MKNVKFQGLLALTLLMAVAVSNSARACSVAIVPTACQGVSPLDSVGTGDSVAIQTFGYVASNGPKKVCSAAEFQILLKQVQAEVAVYCPGPYPTYLLSPSTGGKWKYLGYK